MTKKVVYYRPLQKEAYGYEIVDPKTNKTIRVIDKITFNRWRALSRGENVLMPREFSPNVEFKALPPRPEIAESIRRREEKKYEKELARKEAEYELKKVEKGKVKIENIVFTRKEAKKEFSKLLKKQLKEEIKKEPIKVEQKEMTPAEKVLALEVAKREIKLSEKAKQLLEQRQKEEAQKIKKPTKAEVSFIGGRVKVTGEVFPPSSVTPTPKRPIELFSEKAKKILGISETPEGYLEVGKDKIKQIFKPKLIERDKTFLEMVEEPYKKKFIKRQELIAKVPSTAEVRTVFFNKLGTGKPTKFGFKTNLQGEIRATPTFKEKLEMYKEEPTATFEPLRLGQEKLSDIYAYSRVKSEKYRRLRETKTTTKGEKIKYGLLGFTFGVTQYGSYAIRHPFKATKEALPYVVSSAIAGPVGPIVWLGGKSVIQQVKGEETDIQKMIIGFKTKPFETSGQFAGATMVWGAVSKAYGEPIITKTGKIGRIKTTIFYKSTKGKPAMVGLKFKNRAFIFAKGKKGDISFNTKSIIPISKSVVPKSEVKISEPIPESFFERELPLYEPKSLLKLRKKERIKEAAEKTIADISDSLVKPSVKTPSKIRKAIRKDYLAKRSIKPLDIPESFFERELPLYEPKSLLKLRKKERIKEAAEKTIEDILEGLIPLGKARSSIRRIARKKLARQVKWKLKQKERLTGIKLPEEIYFDIQKLPLPYFEVIKKQKPILKDLYQKRKVIKKTKLQKDEFITRSGQILILESPKRISKTKPKLKYTTIAHKGKIPPSQYYEKLFVYPLAQKSIFDRFLEEPEYLRQQRITKTLSEGKFKDSSERLRNLFAKQKGKIEIQKPIVDIISEQKKATKPIIDIKQEQELKRTPIQKPIVDIISEQKKATKPILEEETTEIQEKDKKKEFEFEFPKFKLEKLRKQKQEAYNVYAKEKGNFIKVNKEPLPKNKALNLGSKVVDNTASATFKIKEYGKTEKADDFIFFRRNKFRKKNDNYIEKNTYRIDTQGEIQGITVKGWLARRKKGLIF